MQNIQNEDLVNQNADFTACERIQILNIYSFIDIPQSYYQETGWKNLTP